MASSASPSTLSAWRPPATPRAQGCAAMLQGLGPASIKLGQSLRLHTPPERLLNQPSKQQLQHWRGCGRSRPRLADRAPVRAALFTLPESLQSWVHSATALGLVVALSLSALPILTGDAKERNEERERVSASGEVGMDNVRWSVMGVLSFLPFVNPLAWVFAALDDEQSSTLYYSFALLYTLPYLANGFELDGFALLALLAGAAHVQVERIACTEAVEVELPVLLRDLLRTIPSALRGLGRYSSSLGSEVGDRARSAVQAQRRRPERKLLEEQSREARMQLEEFDRKRRLRERQRQQEGSRDAGEDDRPPSR